MRLLTNDFKALVLAISLALGFAPQVSAGSYTDPTYGFELTTPDSWHTESATEGSDSVLKIQSPDGNAYGEVRAIHLNRSTTVEHMLEAFRANVVPNGTLAGSADDTHGGLTGKVAAWRMAMDGQQLAIGGFFTANGPVGYILLTVTAEAQFATYSPEYDKIFATFRPGARVTAYADDAPSTPPASDPAGDELFAGLVAEPHPELGFVFTRYDAWHPDMPQPWVLRVGLMEYPAQMRPSIVIEALAGDAYDSLQAGAQDLRAQLSDMQNVQFDQDGPQEVANMAENGSPMPGWSFGATYTLDGMPFRQLTFLFKRAQPSVYYAIYVTGPQEILMQHQPEMMRMLQAIQIVPFSN